MMTEKSLNVHLTCTDAAGYAANCQLSAKKCSEVTMRKYLTIEQHMLSEMYIELCIFGMS